jgi:hypothetical protein
VTVWGPGMPKYGRGGRPISKSRKRTVSSVKKSCDRLWSAIVRAGGECERCGRTSEESQLHAHHVYGRNNHRLRFEPRNGVCLCARCHRWTHDNPLSYATWFREHRSEDDAFLHSETSKGLISRKLSDYLELEVQLLAMKEDGSKAA